MILMNWQRNENKNADAARVWVSRSKMARFVTRQLAGNMQRIYCHEQAALALCRALAANSNNELHRHVFLLLANQESRQLVRRAKMLQRMHAAIPRQCDSIGGIVWRQLLVWLGPSYTLAWIKFVKKGDMRRQLKLVRRLRHLKKQINQK